MQVLSQSSCAAMCMIAGSAAVIEALRGEFTQAKEQARLSLAAVDKEVVDISAE